jgi:DinB family
MATIDEFVNHLDRQFRTLDGVYDRANDSAWAYADQRLKGVWQWMSHVLETIEYYLGDKKSEDFPWGHRFHLDWENAQAESAPGKEAMRAYQKDVEQLVHRVLDGKSDRDLAAPETAHPWTGKTYLGKLLYLMRHTQQHIGDINRVLRFSGCDALEWH